MLDDDPLEQFGSDRRVPDSFGIDDNDGTSCTDAEAGGLAAFHALWTEEEIFAFEQLREEAIERASTSARAAEASRAHDYMMPVWIEEGAVQRHAFNDSGCYVSLHDKC